MSNLTDKLKALKTIELETETNKEKVANSTVTLAIATLGACVMSTLSFFTILMVLVTK